MTIDEFNKETKFNISIDEVDTRWIYFQKLTEFHLPRSNKYR